MTRKAQLEPHFSSSELKTRYLATLDKVERRRWHLIWLVSQKWTIKQAASAVGINYDYALEIVKNYNEQGEGAIQNRHKGKKPRKKALLDEKQLEELKECLKKPPADRGIWTGPKVAAWIAEKTGTEKVWPQRGWE
jgi:transposase